MKKTYFICSLLALLAWGCRPQSQHNYDSIHARLQNMLAEQSLALWYPRVIDKTNGGYYSNFSYNWQKESAQPKFIVTQARHIWTLSTAAALYPDSTQYGTYARHGFLFLKDKMWDTSTGGFYELVDSTGVPSGPDTLVKRAYGNAFAIYALSAYYQLSDDQEALNLAKKTFRWLDFHAHDKQYGGYFQYLKKDGTPILREENNVSTSDQNQAGLKDYNSSIHLLEAFSALYREWPNDTLHDRLNEMYHVVADTMVDKRGFLKLFFYPNWTQMKGERGKKKDEFDHITFGHDVETAYLLLDAAKSLDKPEDEILPTAKKLVDHALTHGWDNENGGFYERGKYIDGKMQILDNNKNWWAQAEGLHSLLLMSTYFPADTNQYFNKFLKQLNYIDQNLIDHKYGGWFSFGIDKKTGAAKMAKAQIWKGNYHTSRALMHCLEYTTIPIH